MTIQVLEQQEITNLNNNLLLYGVNWEQFKALEKIFDSIAGVRLIYLDGILKIMTLSPEHEYYKRILGSLLETYLRIKGIRFYMRGSATLGNKEITGQKEPDESYNIYTKKTIPDLVIEIVVSSGGINTLELYQRIGIPEVWFWEDGVLKIYSLQNNYQQVEKSQLLPDLDLKILTKYVIYHDQYDAVTEFVKELSIYIPPNS
jgi:Uma2 family endonuclease